MVMRYRFGMFVRLAIVICAYGLTRGHVMTDIPDLIRQLRNGPVAWVTGELDEAAVRDDYKEAADALEKLGDQLGDANILTSNMGEEIKELRSEIERYRKIEEHSEDGDLITALREALEEIERLKAANIGIKRMLCKADPERYPPEDNL
jgi:sirohydrochlorin ferrochelatase